MLNPFNIFKRLRSVRKQAVVSPVGIWPLAPRRVALESSALSALEYHRRDRQLDIEFRNGSVYRYFDVPPVAVRDLLSAESAGKEFVSSIRNEYRYQQLGGAVKDSVKSQRAKAAKSEQPTAKKTATEKRAAVSKAKDLISA